MQPFEWRKDSRKEGKKTESKCRFCCFWKYNNVIVLLWTQEWKIKMVIWMPLDGMIILSSATC